MVFYKSLIRPLLFLKDAESTHEQILSILAHIDFLQGALLPLYRVTDPRLSVRLGPLTLTNPVGLAAGFDKNAVAIKALPTFGFGFIEIGAVTAQAQPGNPKPRLFRLPPDYALINRLGFNNQGAAAISERLGRWQKDNTLPRIPLGINVGRTKVVDNKDAASDYLFTFESLYSYGDYFTLNVSSPNTPNLRDLQEIGALEELLEAIQTRNLELSRARNADPKPVFVKIAPDMEFDQLDKIIELLQTRGVTAVIATNATAFLREKLVTRSEEAGGLSGKPLRARSTEFTRHIYELTRGKLPIVGSGGIFSAEDAYEKITAGATAVQIYTGFVYEGPGLVRQINRGLLKLLQRDGLQNITEAVGTSVRL
ncbi:MAG: quinone-dependent dihydroorotate dehydrogenase [Deltaproteobacteria bacterium]|nr:quinone-dependent dihydroorotate dehydrogenase [Deltaproteobacteria bacterium]